VGACGHGATYTGDQCNAWAGGRAGDGYAIQGNCLTGPEVVDAMTHAWEHSGPAASLARRLFAALAAGDEAGGDLRGRQSAALYVVAPDSGYGGASDVRVDLRVDDHRAPTSELARLLDLHELYFGRPDPAALLPLTGALADEVRQRLAALGHTGDDSPAGLDDAMLGWAGMENYEERVVPGLVDPVVLERLRRATPDAAPRER
jgi:uncharacterized Ntn-hydrolase superfamily protein